MKVKIKDLNPNPYRDMENYPINREKVETLKASIKQTGFWDNILAREINGVIQIAYGHHRLIALQETLKDYIVDIPIKKLPDSVMIQVMANENMDEWKVTPSVIDETVKVAKKFLEQHPDEAQNHGSRGPHEIGFRTISKFLSWSEERVKNSLERLGLIESGELEKEVIKKMPTERHAREFASAIKKDPLPKEKQIKFADEIADTWKSDSKVDHMPSKEIHTKILEEKWRPEKKEDKQENERKEKNLVFEQFVRDTLFVSRDLINRVKDVKRIKDELGENLIVNKKDAVLLTANFETLHRLLTELLNNKENE